MSDHNDATSPARNGPLRGPAVELLNSWSAWMADYDVECSGWMRRAAMLLRDVPIDVVANRLATWLAVGEASQADFLQAMFELCSEYHDREVDWAFWVECWCGEGGTLLDDVQPQPGMRMFIPEDAGVDLSAIEDGDDGVISLEVFWFLLAVIGAWAKRAGDLGGIKPGTRWITELHHGDRAHADPLAALLVHFYDRFRAGGYAPTRPLPDTLAISPPLAVRGVKPR